MALSVRDHLVITIAATPYRYQGAREADALELTGYSAWRFWQRAAVSPPWGRGDGQSPTLRAEMYVANRAGVPLRAALSGRDLLGVQHVGDGAVPLAGVAQ